MSEFPPRRFIVNFNDGTAEFNDDDTPPAQEYVSFMEYDDLLSQLEEAKRERDEARKDLTAMQGLFDTATEANLHARSKLSFLTAYAVGLRQALEKITHDEWEVISESTGMRQSGPSAAAQIAETALSIPATDFEKRVQGLVEAVKDHFNYPGGSVEVSMEKYKAVTAALARWEGK